MWSGQAQMKAWFSKTSDFYRAFQKKKYQVGGHKHVDLTKKNICDKDKSIKHFSHYNTYNAEDMTNTSDTARPW